MIRDEDHAAATARRYEIAVRGTVGPSLARALDGFTLVSTEGGESVFRGAVYDQAGLQTALETLASLGLELTTLRSLEGRP